VLEYSSVEWLRRDSLNRGPVLEAGIVYSGQAMKSASASGTNTAFNLHGAGHTKPNQPKATHPWQ